MARPSENYKVVLQKPDNLSLLNKQIHTIDDVPAPVGLYQILGGDTARGAFAGRGSRKRRRKGCSHSVYGFLAGAAGGSIGVTEAEPLLS